MARSQGPDWQAGRSVSPESEAGPESGRWVISGKETLIGSSWRQSHRAWGWEAWLQSWEPWEDRERAAVLEGSDYMLKSLISTPG